MPNGVDYAGQSQERGLGPRERIGKIHKKLSEMDIASWVNVYSYRQPGKNCHSHCVNKAVDRFPEPSLAPDVASF